MLWKHSCAECVCTTSRGQEAESLASEHIGFHAICVISCLMHMTYTKNIICNHKPTIIYNCICLEYHYRKVTVVPIICGKKNLFGQCDATEPKAADVYQLLKH